ncbi:3-oxoacyl-[acyl-carrier-protein] reductase FabG-like protein [Leptotrombidium deliense]|uniref:3-oxoacyl-[acyl-carrier-protein] reductase FabG-like protein n=1 Tax=Leptotrombidium deliense TaxID=299467 RepID=A0A443S3S1_9ACAR|nr:3-oxoacyl-[acyl-carrier-protein] reductase FabG-like protein [Leptotrombidium deliense]
MNSNVDLNLEDKVVLVTGSYGEIGKNTVVTFSSFGCKVVVTGRNVDNLQRVAVECAQVSPSHYQPLVVVCDLNNESDVNNLLRQTIEKFGKLNIIINCAAKEATGSIMDEHTFNDFDVQISIKLRSSIQLYRLALPYLIESKGVIVNVSAIPKPYPAYLNLCLVNAEVDMFTKVLALEFGSAGFVDTETARRVDIDSQVQKWFESVCPLRRMATVDEITKSILFLASDYSSFITGYNLVVDGGFTL